MEKSKTLNSQIDLIVWGIFWFFFLFVSLQLTKNIHFLLERKALKDVQEMKTCQKSFFEDMSLSEKGSYVLLVDDS